MPAATSAVRDRLEAAARRLVDALISPLDSRRLAATTDGPTFLRAIRGNDVAPESRDAFTRIEELRHQLKSDTTPLTFHAFSGSYATGDPEVRQAATEVSDVVTRTVSEVVTLQSKAATPAQVLHNVIVEFRLTHGLELGTAAGISGSYLASAFAINGGDLVTIEGGEAVAQLARRNFSTLGLTNITSIIGNFNDVLIPTLTEHQPFDFLFLDGDHSGKATTRNYYLIKDSLADSAIVIIDDITWSPGMRRYCWDVVARDPDIAVAIRFGRIGICRFQRNRNRHPSRFRLYCPR